MAIPEGAVEKLYQELEKIRLEGESSRRPGQAIRTKKNQIDAALKVLHTLKFEYEQMTGNIAHKNTTTIHDANESIQKCEIALSQRNSDPKEIKKKTRLGLEIKKSENLSEWYTQVITKSEMIDYHDVSGCYFLRPYSMAVWNIIKQWFTIEIKKMGVEEYNFPCLISEDALEAEHSHMDNFEPEVCWITKCGNRETKQVAVRPTSEAIFFPAVAKWIHTYEDLPLKINQWDTAVRWEFHHPQPFLRGREFMWQEGIGAYATKEECCEEQEQILDLYAKVYSDILAVPVIKGRKTAREEFPGAVFTLTIEALISASGRGIQAATAHYYGFNFSKAYDAVFEDPDTKEMKYCHQNGWGLSMRAIGVMVLVHGDDKGLVLPPKAAPVQVIVIPCGFTADVSQKERKSLQDSCCLLEEELRNSGFKVEGDYRNNYSPGWKFNHWELKGVPLRIEVGSLDLKNKQLTVFRRDTGEKIILSRSSASQMVKILLDQIQKDMLQKATDDLVKHTILTKSWTEFNVGLNDKNIILVPYCGDWSCEDKIRDESIRDDEFAKQHGIPTMGAKALCVPTEQPAPILDEDKCIYPECTRKPRFYTLFGRSY